MDLTERLRAWGAVHTQARAAESSAQHAGHAADTRQLQRRAKSLREEADRLHRDIYRSLDAKGRDGPK